MQSVYISDLHTISLKGLQKGGLLSSPDKRWESKGVLSLTRQIGIGSPEVVSVKVSLMSNGEGLGKLSFEYLLSGTLVRYSYDLKRKKSNLSSGGSYFVMVDGDREVWKLYLYSGYFVPRHRLSGLEYETQAESKYWRDIRKSGTIGDVWSLFQSGRKVHYRERLTPYGKTLSRHYEQIQRNKTSLLTDPVSRRQIRRLYNYLAESADPEPQHLSKFIR